MADDNASCQVLNGTRSNWTCRGRLPQRLRTSATPPSPSGSGSDERQFHFGINLDLRAIGFPKDAFGGATVTNVGSLGLDVAYVPLVPYTRVPIFVAPGLVRDEPVVDDGKVVPGRVMYVNASFDHRFIDGYHAMVLSKTLREVLGDPWTHLDPLTRT